MKPLRAFAACAILAFARKHSAARKPKSIRAQRQIESATIRIGSRVRIFVRRDQSATGLPSRRGIPNRPHSVGSCAATSGCAATTNFILARSRNRFFAESRTITSGSISECVTILYRAAGSFPTFRAGSVWDGSTVTRKFLVARDRILRSTFYRPQGFLSRGRSLENKCGSALSASVEWRANRSQSQPEPFRSAGRHELFVLIFAVMSSEVESPNMRIATGESLASRTWSATKSSTSSLRSE